MTGENMKHKARELKRHFAEGIWVRDTSSFWIQGRRPFM